MTSIAILHPGEMGSAIGRALIGVGHEVFWLPGGDPTAGFAPNGLVFVSAPVCAGVTW